jgi:hypothetical protein
MVAMNKRDSKVNDEEPGRMWLRELLPRTKEHCTVSLYVQRLEHYFARMDLLGGIAVQRYAV